MAPLGRLPFVVIASLVIAIGMQAPSSSQAKPAPTTEPAVRNMEIRKPSWTGDFNGMLERRMTRVLVPYSRSLYFNDKGRGQPHPLCLRELQCGPRENIEDTQGGRKERARPRQVVRQCRDRDCP